MAVLAAAVAIGSASPASAALYYWSDTDPGYSRPAPPAPQRRPKPRRQAKKIEPVKESAKPQGPLVIAISIERQTLKIYDANGFYAETPISTGMKGHPTPMGVFSIIQKHKLHHSNIYSGAPMPFMQRITWSGVAMHAGVLPGYPASHGCIRMPLAFATKLWGWTKMGARVVVTPGEISPHSFAHPLLATQKIVPQPVAADQPKVEAPAAAKADRAAETDVTGKPATSVESLELRSTVGHGERTRTQTADARSASAANGSVTMTDAGNGFPPQEAVSTNPDQAINADAKPEAAAATAAEAKPSGAATAEIKSAQTEVADNSEKTSDEPAVVAQASGDAANTEGVESAKAQEAKVEAKAGVIPGVTEADAPKAAEKTAEKAPEKSAEKSSENPDESVTATTSPSVPDVKKDQTRLPALDKPVLAKPEPPKRTGQIAAFVSRKDGKLYVRQNFAPLFDVPVTIAPSDRPLGTHVFTAQVDKDDANLLRWSVVSLPAPTRYAERRDEDERASRRRRMTGGAETKLVAAPAPNSPAEALDRLSIPADAMARIVDALSTGGSIVVSDRGIAGGETGEGTDFIVSLR
jgi:lipoprotein-anchoring transpeptidase ErfK/SrfK